MLRHRPYIYCYIFSRATLNETFTAICKGVLPRTPWDQNPKFTPLSETTSIPTPFICGVPPPPSRAPSPSQVFPAYFSLLCPHALIAWNKLPLNKKTGNQFFCRVKYNTIKKSQPFFYEFCCICQEYSQTCIKQSPFGNGLLTAVEVDHLIQVW